MSKRIKRNKYAQTVDAVLDLHGLTVVEAEAEVTSFLNDSRQARLARVRVITGKGINSLNGHGVLKSWLTSYLGHKGHNYRMAKMTEGGEGAFDIDLS